MGILKRIGDGIKKFNDSLDPKNKYNNQRYAIEGKVYTIRTTREKGVGLVVYLIPDVIVDKNPVLVNGSYALDESKKVSSLEKPENYSYINGENAYKRAVEMAWAIKNEIVAQVKKQNDAILGWYMQQQNANLIAQQENQKRLEIMQQANQETFNIMQEANKRRQDSLLR